MRSKADLVELLELGAWIDGVSHARAGWSPEESRLHVRALAESIGASVARDILIAVEVGDFCAHLADAAAEDAR